MITNRTMLVKGAYLCYLEVNIIANRTMLVTVACLCYVEVNMTANLWQADNMPFGKTCANQATSSS